jgi:hypothetical protein
MVFSVAWGKRPCRRKAIKPAKKPRKASSGQTEMLMSIQSKKPKESATKKPAARPHRKRPDAADGRADRLWNIGEWPVR